MPYIGSEIYEFADFRLDISERLLFRNGERVQLADKPFEVLCVLVRASGHLVLKDELLTKVWEDAVVEENNLDKSVSSLRNVLGQPKGKQTFIETVRGHGYRFVHHIIRVDAHAMPGIADVRHVEPTPNFTRRHGTHSANVVALADWPLHDTHEKSEPSVIQEIAPVADLPVPASTVGHRGLAYAAIALLLVAATIGGVFFYVYYPARITSVAVLPFVNASQDPNAEYLSDGITESIINNLSHLPGMKVMSRNSAFHFKNDQGDTRRIASQLGVAGIITGDIRQMGDKLVVNVRLINAADDAQIWGEQYVRGSADVIAIQNEIATDISRGLGARLAGKETAFEKRSTVVPEAYKAYLKGRYHLEKYNPRDNRKALEYLQQAMYLDPNFAAAHAFTAAVYTGLAGAHDFPRAETVAKAKELALKSIVLDDQLATGHEVYGVLLSRYDYNFAEGMRELRRALELDPSDASARETYAGLLTNTGDHEQALREVRLAQEINPLSTSVTTTVGYVLLFARRYDEALTQYQETLELDGRFVNAHYGMSIVYQMQQNYAASVEERAIIADILGDAEGAAFIRKSFARGGWQEFLHQMITNDQAPQTPPYVRASLLTEVGEFEEAFEILIRLCDEKSSSVTFLKVDPRFDRLRGDPRFDELLRRMNLAEI